MKKAHSNRIGFDIRSSDEPQTHPLEASNDSSRYYGEIKRRANEKDTRIRKSTETNNKCYVPDMNRIPDSFLIP